MLVFHPDAFQGVVLDERISQEPNSLFGLGGLEEKRRGEELSSPEKKPCLDSLSLSNCLGCIV